jgi:cation diffusion facilitator CzcD-associated flavoprotein CzcO
VSSSTQPTVCIIGAGPYGLAIAAHLRFVGQDFRIFGSPMRRWLSQMPQAMLLKSEGCASSLPDPAGRYSLAQYCREESLPYGEYGVPNSRETFVKYALSYQQKLVPDLEDIQVSALNKLREGFELHLTSGETLQSPAVVVATGLDYMTNVPEQLRALPTELCSHAADHYELSKFRGKEVAVIGGGQSGLETAALLREAGASATLLLREPTIAWNRVPSTVRRPLYKRLRRPRTRLGEGLQLWVYENAPLVFHSLPRQMRLSRVKKTLGPAGAWWLKDRVVGQIPVFLGHRILAVTVRGGRVALQITDRDERPKELIADHVIAATGYRFDLNYLPFLGQSLKSQLRHEEQTPQLSTNFESSIHGLYFTGLASANSFGPAMRFIVGTSYTARRISLHITKQRRSPADSFVEQEKCLEP